MKHKRLTDLNLSDLTKFKVWETWTDTGIEYVRPSTKKEVFEESNIVYIVLTEFTAQNGKKYLGFCSPQDTSALDYIQPIIISENGQVEFWKNSGWTKDDKKVALTKLGITNKDLFPIHYRTKIKSNNEFYNGTIEDFNK